MQFKFISVSVETLMKIMFSIENWRLILLRKFELKNSSNEIKLERTLKGQKSSSMLNVKIGTLIYCKVKWKTAGVTAMTSSSALSKYVSMCTVPYISCTLTSDSVSRERVLFKNVLTCSDQNLDHKLRKVNVVTGEWLWCCWSFLQI